MERDSLETIVSLETLSITVDACLWAVEYVECQFDTIVSVVRVVRLLFESLTWLALRLWGPHSFAYRLVSYIAGIAACLLPCCAIHINHIIYVYICVVSDSAGFCSLSSHVGITDSLTWDCFSTILTKENSWIIHSNSRNSIKLSIAVRLWQPIMVHEKL